MTPVDIRPAIESKSARKKAGTENTFFYEGGGRSKILSQISHCVKFSPGVIVLSGPTGSGRSLLLQAFTKSFKPEDGDLCLLSEDSQVLETEEELYRALAHGFGLEEKPVELLEDLVDRVQHFIRVGLRGKQNLLIAIDDVKQHSLDVLEILLQLAASNKGLSLLLVGEASLLETLKQFHTQSLLVHHISLRPLLTEEAFDFVRQYLQRQGIADDSVLTRKTFDEMMSKTGGNLSLLVRESRQFAINLQLKSAREPSKFPLVHMLALVGVLTVTTLAFLYYPTNSNVEAPDTTDTVAANPAHAVVTQASREIQKLNSVAVTNESQMPHQLPDQPGANEVVSTTKAVESQVAAPMDIHNLPDETTAIKPPSVTDDLYTEQERELMSMPEAQLVLQVANLSSIKAVDAYISQLSASDQKLIRYYRRHGKAGDAYIVLYGQYADKRSAMEVQKTFSLALRKTAPWPRKIAEIQRELAERQ